MSRENWCKHYHGLANGDECRAGVKYDLVVLGKGTKECSYPCFKDRNPLGATCEHCVFETPDETAARKAEQAKAFERMGKVRAAIVTHLGGPWKKGMKGNAGSISCPCCDGGCVNFSRSGYNGHIHASCSTPDCAAWME